MNAESQYFKLKTGMCVTSTETQSKRDSWHTDAIFYGLEFIFVVVEQNKSSQMIAPGFGLVT